MRKSPYQKLREKRRREAQSCSDSMLLEIWAQTVFLPRLLKKSDKPSEPKPSGPLTTWRAIAKALRVSEDTVLKRRKEKDDHTEPWFTDSRAVYEWYAKLIAPEQKLIAPESKPAPRPRRNNLQISNNAATEADFQAAVNEAIRLQR